MSEINQNHKHGEDVEYMRIRNTTYKVTSFYSDSTSLLDIIKNSLKRDAQAALRQMDNK